MSLTPILPTAGTPFQTGISSTQYQGRAAYRIDVSTKKLNIGATLDMQSPIDVVEDGVLIGWTIAVNDPNITVTCVLYGDAGSFTSLNDVTMREVAFLGRGLTLGQAESISPQQVSLDQKGQKDDIWPWLQRYKHTYSLGHLNDSPASIRGTEFDKWIVLAYTPTIKENYTRLVLNVTNNNTTDQLIHLFQCSRIKFANSSSPIPGQLNANYARLDFS